MQEKQILSPLPVIL